MNYDNIYLIFSALLVLLVGLGFSNLVSANTFGQSNDQQSWSQSTGSTLQFTYLQATIHITIHNIGDHAAFFKISQQYTGDGTVTVSGTNSSSIDWIISSTNPPAIRMVNSINPAGDLGWEVDSGQTRSVSFTLVESSPKSPWYIQRGNTNNTFWPVVNDPGLTATWFLPNELEYMNPNLKVVSWQGNFFFNLKNIVPSGPRVEGIVRAPIVPLHSVLTASSPTVDYIDTEVSSAQTAAWDVTLNPGQTKGYSYTYNYPTGTPVTPVNRQSSSTLINDPSSAANNTSTLPTRNTGVPWGLFLIGGIVIAAGIIYARVLR
jgi:hypothetical protein